MSFEVSPDDLKVFLQEAEQLLESLDDQILRLEQEGASPAFVQEIFRVAHTLKGSSAMLGYERMTALTHAMEDILDRVRKGTIVITEEIIDALLLSLDGLKVLKDGLATGAEAHLDVDGLVAMLRRTAETGPAPVQEAPADDLDLDEAAVERVREGFRAGRAVLRVHATLDPASEWRAVRCFQLLNEMERVAEVVASVPTPAEVEREAVGDALEAIVVLDVDAGDVESLLAPLRTIEDVREVTAAAFDLRATDETTAAAAAAIEGVGGARVDSLQSTVRVDVEQIDALMNMVGELVIDRTRVSELSRILSAQYDDDHVRSLAETAAHVEKIVDELHERMMQVRMLPVGMLFSKFPRLVRDLSRSLGKSVRLDLEGEDTEIDRSVIERIKDPLVHLIRNALDHGIETPEGRMVAGKPEQSILRLTAHHEQGQIVMALADDGGGVDADRVRAKAVERGLMTAEMAGRLSHAEAVDLIFEPGLTTAATTTEVSGRGVGMDIVRRDIEALGGRIEVETVPGEGTTFRLRLPLTLATFQGLLVACGPTTYAVPLTYVQETLRAAPDQIHTVNGRAVLHLRTTDTVMPLARLDEVLRLGSRPAGRGRRGDAHPYVVVVRASESETDTPVALAVDRLIHHQDIVVKSLSGFLGGTRGIAGASILGDGQVALILDVPALIKASRNASASTSGGALVTGPEGASAGADALAFERIAS
ncbi:MAG: chemotaxis protein CheA [Dehalococcoidia bacterium]|nr:chemotaxis protein CheA [Dehalococcoidia bacterium]